MRHRPDRALYLPTMTTASTFNDMLEDINARVLAADPADALALMRVVDDLAEVLKTLEPDSKIAEVLHLGLCGLQNAENLNQTRVLDALAAAIAATSQFAADPDHEYMVPDRVPRNSADMAALDTAADALRELLACQGPDPSLPAQSVLESAHCPTPTAELALASAEANTVQWNSDKELVEEFVADASDRITAAEAAILALESNPEDREAVHTVLRAFHSIKGVAGFLELSAVQNLAHHAENLLIRGRDGEIRITGKYANLALECCDTLKRLIDSLRSGADCRELVAPDNLPALIEALSEHDHDHEHMVPAGPAEACAEGSEGQVDGGRWTEREFTVHRPPTTVHQFRHLARRVNRPGRPSTMPTRRLRRLPAATEAYASTPSGSTIFSNWLGNWSSRNPSLPATHE